MKFAEHRRKLKLVPVKDVYIPLNKIKIQYNGDLHKAWKKVCGTSYRIDSTPYYYYLKHRRLDKYLELMRLYGRSDTWTTNNIAKFVQLVESIKENGYQGELPVVLEKPILENDYNNGCEVWEGHRRLSICLYMGIKQKVKLCRIL